MSHLILRAAAPVFTAALLILAGALACNRSNADRGSGSGSGGMKQPAGAPLPERGLTTRPMADHWMQTPELKALMARLAQAADATRQPLAGDPQKPWTPEEQEKAYANAATLAEQLSRSEERRVGKEGRSRWWAEE